MNNKQMTASTSVRIRVDDVKVFGPGIAELLERIDRCESIRTATMEMKIAYSKAWTMLRSCEAALGYPLIQRKVGGAGGGGSTLTPEGRSLLERYRQWEADCKAYAKAHLADLFPEAAECSFRWWCWRPGLPGALGRPISCCSPWPESRCCAIPLIWCRDCPSHQKSLCARPKRPHWRRLPALRFCSIPSRNWARATACGWGWLPAGKVMAACFSPAISHFSAQERSNG